MPKQTIMIVDDSPSFRKVLNLTLSEAGYGVVEACDGQDALSKLNGQHIHLLICDLAMPNMDGMEFLHKFRYLAAYRFTPIIVLSTDNRVEKKQEGREIGVKVWMVKPFQPERMLDAVSKLISGHRVDSSAAVN